MHEIIMPKLGLTMRTGIIKKWHKSEGDKVKKGEILFDVETDKVTSEVVSDYEGTLVQIVNNESEEVPVLQVIAYINPDA
jgi:pyruvate/2-oxoglutarate dehydrogenase complex dihydrolipoamide acyltransferase (E2) component